MFIINTVAFLLLILLTAYRFKVSALKAWPVAVSVLVMVLYVLAYFKALGFIDIISIAFIAAFLAFGFINKTKEKRKEYFMGILLKARNTGFIIGILSAVIMTVLVKDKLVTWWDEINFWANDVKALFFTGGFAPKYCNVSPEFGDYPPGTQLIKWWFAHMNKNKFSEGLMFAGYYFMLFSFMLPVLDRIKVKSKVFTAILQAVGAVFIWLFLSSVESFWMDGSCADVIMAVIYGLTMISLLDRDEEMPALFYYGRTALFMSVLSLCKDTSFIWVGFLYIFCLGYMLILKKDKEYFAPKDKTYIKGRLLVLLLPMLTLGSWYGFCILMRRIAAHTGSAIEMASGRLALPEYQGQLTKLYMEAFIRLPLHRYYNGIINLSPLVLLLILTLVSLALAIFRITGKKEGILLFIYIVFSGVCFYIFNLLCHLFIFVSESQYLEAPAMVASIERYGSPFTVGSMMLLIYIMLKKLDAKYVLSALALFILLTADYSGTARAFITYKEVQADVLKEREDIVGDKGREFKKKAFNAVLSDPGRVLFIVDTDEYSLVQNTYISYEVCPVPVVYEKAPFALTESAYEQDILRMADEAHAVYVYMNGTLRKADKDQNKLVEYPLP